MVKKQQTITNEFERPKKKNLHKIPLFETNKNIRNYLGIHQLLDQL